MFINYCYDWMYFLFTSLLCVRQQARYSCISCSVLKHTFSWTIFYVLLQHC